MPFIFILAWRNLWRNPLRSIALLLSISLGVGAGLLSIGFVNGLLEQRFVNTIQTETSHLQIHHPDFRGDRETRYFIENAPLVLDYLGSQPTVINYTTRTLANGIIASAAATSGVEIVGVDPIREDSMTGFSKKVIEGGYFEEKMRNPVIVGKKLADKLNLSLKSRVVLSFQDVDGNIVSAAFRLSGIYRTHNAMADEMKVYVQQDDLQANIGGNAPVHQIAVLINDHNMAKVFAEEVNTTFPEFEALSWDQLSAELKYMVDQASVSMYIFMFIILLGLGFGILNTMLMVVFERTRELGMLMALGMKKLRVFAMIMYETILLAFTGTLLGIGIGWAANAWLNKVGLNMGSGLTEFGYDPITYPILEGGEFLNVSIMVFFIAVIAAIYPAIKAINLIPAEAVKK